VNKTVAGLLSCRRAARQVSAAIQSLDHNGPLASRILHHIHENAQIRVGGLVRPTTGYSRHAISAGRR